MAFWEGSFQTMDPLTLSTIIQLQLEDSEHLTANGGGEGKGKQREGTLSDAQLALQMYTEDLVSTNAVLSDRRMAQSIAMAVIRDARAIQRSHLQEDQIARDHEIAQSLQSNAPAPLNIDPTTKEALSGESDPWADPEMLEKVTAIYMCDPGLILPLTTCVDGTVAESSAWAARRTGGDKPKIGHCVICGEDVEFYEVSRVPCDHEYCRPCLAKLFELSMTDETLFPPRCCKTEIPLTRVRFFLPPDLAKCFEATYAEFSTKNRVYCHHVRCNSFIPTTAVDASNDVATCPRCARTTCAICKGPSHTGDCPNDTALQQLVDIANTEQWQRCLDCKRFVELEQGCNHMTPLVVPAEPTSAMRVSRHAVIFPALLTDQKVCGERWKTCACLQWEENRLVHRAAQIVDRNPNPRRRLFEPQRVMHAQPVSRRASTTASAFMAGAITALGEAASPASSVWQSDFEDRSEWEHDWPDGDSDDDDGMNNLPPAQPGARSADAAPAPQVTPTPTTAQVLRERAIAEAVEHLRQNHECDHDKWRWVRGPHQCGECYHMLPQYIFRMQAMPSSGVQPMPEEPIVRPWELRRELSVP
ncbi:hypothetical protein LTR35_012868 [Friedmanniomyces endolithicus]|uniref:RBR-type E3 ubiquitin transferase n=1 Tax=Friedmanniomyces endolithicus TaxID=329885 RepID=A0AAN6FN72_9PEZI|nr:hypothetical protein LTR35_012868 [Friedmanniomyces endolithicus]KAK0285428.1 hypothetical protein LTS00_010789 [Friedmanniomyces endolithicus]KAK0321479.1 hypothetical protein LTR82_007447 [Friedmanniomyces endolithicus]KAK0986896.1 hypothetical protein LTR54_013280 [Friedmanniomyces endolithicus]